LKTEVMKRALHKSDYIKYLPSLSLVKRFVDAHISLGLILESSWNPGELRATAPALARAISSLHSASPELIVGDETAKSLLMLVQAIVNDWPSSSIRRTVSAKQIAATRLLLVKSLLWVLHTKSGDLLQLLLALLSSTRSRVGLDDWVMSSDLAASVDALAGMLDRATYHHAQSGDVVALRNFIVTAREIPPLTAAAERIVSQMMQNRAIFGEQTQLLLGELSEAGQASAIPLLDAERDSPQMLQLGLAVLASWRARNDSVLATEAFDVLSNAAASFFGVRLMGEPGTVVDYSARVHECVNGESPATSVQVIQPAVVRDYDERSETLIKALVKGVNP
jgi:hypothetical protein